MNVSLLSFECLSVLVKYSLHFRKKEKYTLYQLSFRYGVSFKNILGESKSLTEEMTTPWTETTLLTYSMPTNSDFSTKVYPIKHCIWKEKSALEESAVKSISEDGCWWCVWCKLLNVWHWKDQQTKMFYRHQKSTVLLSCSMQYLFFKTRKFIFSLFSIFILF